MIRFPESPVPESPASNAASPAPTPPGPTHHGPEAGRLEALGDEIAELAAHIHAATYRLLVRLREFDALFEEAGGLWGFRSVAHWLSWRTGMSPLAARERVRAARALGSLPLVSAAMERGELSYSKVRALTRIEVRDPETEEELLDVARESTAAEVEKLVRTWRRLEGPEEEAAEAEQARHQRRKLVLHPDEDGSWVVRGRLDPEVGALLEKALDLAAEALYRKERSRERAQEEREPLERRRADAVGLVAEAALRAGLAAGADGATGETEAEAPEPDEEAAATATSEVAAPVSRADRFQVVLHVDLATLRDEGDGRGRCSLGDDLGVPAGTERPGAGTRAAHRPRFRETWEALLPRTERLVAGGRAAHRPRFRETWEAWLPSTGRRLSCDASRVVMVHDEDGHVLDVGRRSRTVPTAMRRALDHRDRHCRFPACTSRFTDAHHIEHWATGGETKLDNLVLLCRRHHRAVHEEGFGVERTDEGTIRFRRPDGAVIPEAPALPAVEGDPVELLREPEVEAGIEVDAWTAAPRGDAGPFDVDLALGFFLDVPGEAGPNLAGSGADGSG